MIWRLQFTSTAQREIAKLDPPVHKQLEKDLASLAAGPLGGKILRGSLKGIRSWRSGDYRILYGISPEAEHLIVYRVAHRREVYR